mmetsp:Transcript_39861/g.68786  ORF Transcript_39861/g.68786 Transcript_39861/m.68786 type:complete len:122 (+) Transcript_39861:632-997(+)
MQKFLRGIISMCFVMASILLCMMYFTCFCMLVLVWGGIVLCLSAHSHYLYYYFIIIIIIILIKKKKDTDKKKKKKKKKKTHTHTHKNISDQEKNTTYAHISARDGLRSFAERDIIYKILSK